MRKLDRAVCAIFLLVLLADVARAHASVPMAGDAAGGLMLAVSQLQQPGPMAEDAISGLRRAGRSGHSERGFASFAGLCDYGQAFSAWSRVLKSRSHTAGVQGWSNGAELADVAGLCAPESGTAFAFQFTPDDASLAVFTHTGSPAP